MNERTPVTVLPPHDWDLRKSASVVQGLGNVVGCGSFNILAIYVNTHSSWHQPVVTHLVANTSRKVSSEAIVGHWFPEIIRQLNDASKWPIGRIVACRRVVDSGKVSASAVDHVADDKINLASEVANTIAVGKEYGFYAFPVQPEPTCPILNHGSDI
jgi:hypothetical protein